MDTFSVTGVWWLPRDPDEQLTGTLTYSPEHGASLELVGSFDKPFGTIYAGMQLPGQDLILGVGNGKSVTLYRCANLGTGMDMPGTMHQRFRPSVVFTGELFESERQLFFDRLSIAYTHLFDWSRLSGINVRMFEEGERLEVYI